MTEIGKLYGVGVGPGDPELITIKALHIIQNVPVLAIPATEKGDSFARSIIADYIMPETQELYLRFPIMATAGKALYDAYDSCADEILSHLKQGKDIAMICEGDPFFYGSFAYIFMRLKDYCDVGIIPGVSSIMAGAAQLQSPLVLRNDCCMIIPTTLSNEEIIPYLQLQGTKIFMKISRHWQRLYDLLNAHKLADNAMVIQHASLPQQYISTAHDLKDLETLPYFSLLYIHGVYVHD